MATKNIYADGNSCINVGKPTSAGGSGGGVNLGVSSGWICGASTDTAGYVHGVANTPFEAALYQFNMDFGASTLNSATLHIYGGGSTMSAPAIIVYPIAAFTEATVTWNTQPAHGTSLGKLNVFRRTIGTLASKINEDSCNEWQTINVTGAELSGYIKVMLYPDSGYDFTTSFGAREGSHPPYVTIDYT